MKIKYIYQHLGLGDHIICNGLIREIIKQEPNVFYKIFVKDKYYHSLNFLYKDLTQLDLIPINSDYNVREFLINNNICNEDVIKIGFFNSSEIEIQKNGITWDEVFYKQHNIPFEKRWNSFFIQRNQNSEHKLFEKLNPENVSYALIHSTGSDNIDRIDYSKICTNLKQIYVDPKNTNNIFDYIGLIKNATEIHCVASCFFLLVDSIKNNSKLFFHNNKIPRVISNLDQPKINQNWEYV